MRGIRPRRETTRPQGQEEFKKIKSLERLLAIVTQGKAMWQSTFDAIADPVTIVGRDFLIKRANLAAASLAQRDIKEVIGNSCYRLLAGRREPCEGCPMMEGERDREPSESRLFRFSKTRDFHVRAYPMTEGEWVMHYRDITEETKMQHKLIHAERLATVGMLAGNVAHEINNPLGGILAFAQIASRDLPADHPAHDDLEEIRKAAQRCKAIVDDLLNLARQPDPQPQERLDVNKAIESTLPLIRLRMKEGGATVVESLAPDLPQIRGNAVQIQQVVVNLLTNALHAVVPGGEVRLITRPAKGRRGVEIVVHDNGCGIPPENLSKIFDPFFTTRHRGEGGGVGLGLAITRNIVWEHGGEIDVESRVGHGSTFTVALPAMTPESSAVS